MRKKLVCYISRSEDTSRFIAKQLKDFLGEFIDIYVWCLEHEDTLPHLNCDIYIAGSKTVLKIVKNQLPPKSHVIIATRNIGNQNIDKLFEIPPKTHVAVVGYWEELALSTIDILKEYGFNYFEMIPYYSNCVNELPEDVEIAISPGLNYVLPKSIKKIIDIGVKGLDLSTFVDIIEFLHLPREIINIISHNYIQAISNLSYKHYKAARINEVLKKNTEVIIDTVDEAIVSVNESNKIVVFNPVAEKLLEVNKTQVMNRDVREVIPQVDFLSCLQTGHSIKKEIKCINGNYFILSTNPIVDENGTTSGVVSVFRPVREIKEMDVKVRRELRAKGNVANHTFSHIIGESDEVTKVIHMAKRFAKTDLTILLEGESGTGKEVFAQAIHNYSDRNDKPFVAINFAALPQTLVESELFGYEGGAFTGAKKEGKSGLFEEAHTGTIFLDEIGDASMEVQKNLLRVLEERKVRRVGGNTLIPVDVRVIAATNQNLELLMKEGLFREDLFYRLCTLPILIPSLRLRGEDILLLINYFSNKLYNRTLRFELSIKDFLLNYRWPGNIRELQNVVKYLCSMVELDEAVAFRHLPTYMIRKQEMVQEVTDKEPRHLKQNIYDEVVTNFCKLDLLEPMVLILSEIHSLCILKKGIGRTEIHKKIKTLNNEYTDHNIRNWLKILAELGYVDIGKTKQGSRISSQGEAFLTYVKEKVLQQGINCK